MPRNTRVVDVTSNGSTVQVPLVVDRAANGDEAVCRAIVLNDVLVSTSNRFPVDVVFPGTQPVSLATLPALAAGSNAIGSVSVSNFPATQPVSLATLPALATGANVIGSVGLQVNSAAVALANPMPVHRTSRNLAAANTNTSAANAAAVVTYAAVAGQSNIISGIAFSYSATPAAGSLTITDGATTVFSIDILSGGAGFIPFDAPVRGSTNTALTITLAAGGTGVVGKVSVFSRWTEA